MESTGYSVAILVAMVIALAALAVAVMFSRRYGQRVFGGARRQSDDAADIGALTAELRRANDLMEQRVFDHETRLRRLEGTDDGNKQEN